MKAKMKMTRLLALALLTALALPAWALAAQDALVARNGLDGFDGHVDSICAVGDVVWAYGWPGVYAYDASTGGMTAYPFAEAWDTASHGVYDPEKGDIIYRGVFAWFSWNDQVYVLVNTAVRGGMTDAELCRLTINDQDEADFESVGSIDWQPLENDGYVQIDSCCVVNDVLCTVSWQGDQRLCFIPLDGSRAEVTDVFCSQLCPYEDGVLAVEEAWENGKTEYIFYQVEVPSGRKTELARFAPEEGELEAPVQEAGSGRVLFVCNGYLTALDPASGGVERIAPVPIGMQQSKGAGAAMLPCGAYAAGGYEGVVVRQVTGRAASDTIELVVGQTFRAEALDEAALTFDRSHPGVTVATVDANQVVEQLLTHMDDIDIFVMHTQYGSEASIGDILSRGYALELDSDMLTGYVSGMYPALRDAFTRNGRVVAVPLSAEAMGLSINAAGLESLGLTMEDVPTNWPDFLAFMNSLKGNGKVPVVSAWSDLLNVRYPLMNRLLMDYELELQAGRQTSWAGPALHAALEALANVDFDGLIEDAQALEGAWAENPLVNSYDSVGVSGVVFTNPYEGYPLRLSVSADSPVVMPVQCTVAIVNPASRHPAEATALLEAAIDHVSHAERAMLSPDFGEAERDEAAYQRAAEDIKRQNEWLQARVDAGDESAVSELTQSLEFQANMDNYYWTISEDSLLWYRAHDDNVMLSLSGELDESGAMSLIDPAADIDPDAIISVIEKKAQMRRLEK